MLAHHRDDQAETVLFRLLRGCGVQGAAAMRPFTAYANGVHILRPLLATDRACIEAYAAEQGLAWIEDESNGDTRYARNALRRDFLPQLVRRFPAARRQLAHAARRFAEAADLLDDMARDDLHGCGSAKALMRIQWQGLAMPRQRNLLRYWLRLNGVRAPDEARLEDAIRQLSGVKPVRIDLGDCALWAYDNEMRCVPPWCLDPPPPLRWQGEAQLAWAMGMLKFKQTQGRGLSHAAVSNAAVRVEGRGAQRLRLAAGGPAKSLKNLWQEHHVPAWLRPCLPVVHADGRMVWAAAAGYHADWLCKPGERGLEIVWDGPADFRQMDDFVAPTAGVKY